MHADLWQLSPTPLPLPRAAGERRRGARRPLAVTGAGVIAAGMAEDAAVLEDLSIHGCRLAVAGWHDEGDRLWLRFDGGWPIAATVVWTDGRHIGCRFDEPLAGSLMRELNRVLS